MRKCATKVGSYYERYEEELKSTYIVAGRINISDMVNGRDSNLSLTLVNGQEVSIKSYLIHPDYIGVTEGDPVANSHLCMLLGRINVPQQQVS